MTIPLDPSLVFDRFIVGPANRVAAAAALRARLLDPELLVHYETVDAFIDRLTATLAGGTLEDFRAASAGVDLFLLDGLAGVAGKSRTQEELLRLVAELVGRGAQLVVASEEPPSDVPALDPELVERLAGGLNVELASLDSTTRRAIIARLLADRGNELPEEVVAALADLSIPTVRELQGAVDRVIASAELENRPATLSDVQTVAHGIGGEEIDGGDEFDTFLSDISTAVAAVVETAPWRRRLAAAILRWEGEGIRTRRLEEALDADSAPDVDALLTAFGRDVGRLRQISRELPSGAAADPLLLRDPDRLAEAERLLAETAPASSSAGPPATGHSRSASTALPGEAVDRWFLDREKLAWDWLALDDRLVEEQR